jgi:hypothetical protein
LRGGCGLGMWMADPQDQHVAFLASLRRRFTRVFQNLHQVWHDSFPGLARDVVFEQMHCAQEVLITDHPQHRPVELRIRELARTAFSANADRCYFLGIDPLNLHLLAGEMIRRSVAMRDRIGNVADLLRPGRDGTGTRVGRRHCRSGW